jgi:hypothetical protein
MALFGSDRPVMPTFKTPPDLDSAARSPYDDLNRLERNPDRSNDRNSDRNGDRNGDRHSERNLAHPQGRGEDPNAADLRAQDRLERALDRNGRDGERDPERNPDRNREPSRDREPEQVSAKAVQQASRKSADGTDPLIQGLFSKLPQPSTEWPLPARQKWLQTAANIFDLMYETGEADAGELAIRVERNSTR